MADYLGAFRQGMGALGWVEGRDYVLDIRVGDSLPQSVERNAAELIARQPDVLLVPGDTSARALAQRTKTIPIVFAMSADPIARGFAASLQRPGGNMTGVTNLGHDLVAKRLQLLQEVSPRIKHVGVLFDPSDALGVSQLKAFEEAGPRLKIRIARMEIRQAPDIGAAFSRGAQIGVDAYALSQGPTLDTHGQAIAEGLLRLKRPAITPFSRLVEAGVLMSYSPSLADNFRRAAAYVDKILKGARPGDLPIEQPTKFELVVNLKTAKAIGLNIPQSFLVRADRVIQ